ncbi:hypothetical protein GQ53DRAFT_755880 [Thozetella sp. PMI_491]|nr:hypothetical protein GQ53DRAFT_755880 [Thozetella sp. PMI_491]
MCHTTRYTLPCGHVQERTVYCNDATESNQASSSTAPPPTCSQSKQKKAASGGSKSSNKPKSPPFQADKETCENLQIQSVDYPLPPSAQDDPATYPASLLFARCPLETCPFEQKNRFWNCCWCGKRGNVTGRCTCVLVFEGNLVRCEHFCCATCEEAVRDEEGEAWGGYA